MARSAPPLGAMRHRVILERIDTSLDGTRTTAVVATLWAAIEPVDDGEASLGAHMAGYVTYRLTLRWRSDVTSAHQVRLGTRVFVPLTVFDPDETRRRLVIMAREDNR